ncbi:SDR family NAD(P)-dependent oxidoreductase [Elioraea sp.]|uniref:SDR family NAD(P)-dependent oxidoreductase n=1 Tax=Elioraea sp. TaxID=2185103 RepID=UPI0025BA5181|nr:SDR family oxidoreductase [Elioraea sp.]
MERVVLVTGGASGIGFATARVLGQRGWRIGLIDRDVGALGRAAATLGAASAAADVADEASIAAAVAALADTLGAPSGLVNSAGIAADIPAMDTEAEHFRRILDVNVLGSFLAARAAARLMMAAGGGAIVNIASVSGLVGNLGRVAYGASKAAVLQMTRVLAVEWAEAGIRVNAVAPGPVEGPLVETVQASTPRAMWTAALPLHRYAAPEEIATTIAFLLDPDQSGFVTGACLPVDGGFTAGGLIRPDHAP